MNWLKNLKDWWKARQRKREIAKGPKNLEEAITQLKLLMTPQDILDMKSAGGTELYHHGIGLSLRNRWGLWAGPLSEWFNECGIYHADDMSGIILTSFQRDLRGEPRELGAQIKYYRDFWIRQGYDPDNLGGGFAKTNTKTKK